MYTPLLSGWNHPIMNHWSNTMDVYWINTFWDSLVEALPLFLLHTKHHATTLGTLWLMILRDEHVERHSAFSWTYGPCDQGKFLVLVACATRYSSFEGTAYYPKRFLKCSESAWMSSGTRNLWQFFPDTLLSLFINIYIYIYKCSNYSRWLQMYLLPTTLMLIYGWGWEML